MTEAIATGRTKTITVDSSAVSISSKGGLMGALSGGGGSSIRVPLRQIQSVEWKDASSLSNGYIRVCVSGMTPLRSDLMGGKSIDVVAARDSNSVVFSKKSAEAFKRVRAAIERQI